MSRRSTRAFVTTLGLLASVYQASLSTFALEQLAGAMPSESAEAPGRIEVVVIDPTGALVPHAVVELRPEIGGDWMVLPHTSGRWTAAVPARNYQLRITAQGFEARTIGPVGVGRGTTRRTVRLVLDKVETTVVVERDPRTVALDPRGFSTFLSREQIDALPDDPVEIRRVLQEMAPPGAILRIDGFTGGVMPAKTQILSIRIPRLDGLAAQDHGGLNAFSAIDIVTRPGAGDLQGNVGGTARSAALNARNPLAASKVPDDTVRADLALAGPIQRDRASFSFDARGSAQSEGVTIRAAIPGDEGFSREITRPTIGLTLGGRITAILHGEQTLRGSFFTEQRQIRNAGAGNYNLEDRRYDSSSFDHILRLSTGGPWGRRRYAETRVQLRWSGTRNVSFTERPTLQVLDAFTAGGAQATNGERAFAVEAASDVDYARGGHAWRMGVLLDATDHVANRRANYLGTYVFTSLAAFEAGRPAFFTKRVGDARVAYKDVQLGAYVQDDYRLSRSVLLSYGTRAEWQGLLANRPSLLPRAGLTWSPRTSGTPTVRASWGLVRDWIPTGVYEQTLLVDGQRQYDLRIAEPAFPDPGDITGGTPRERFVLGGDLELPRGQAVSLGIEHQVSAALRLFVSSSLRTGQGLLRGRNLNPILDGHRLDESSGNVIETRGDGQLRGRTVTIQSIYASRARRFEASATYMLNRSESNSGGPFWMPQDGDDLSREWGPVASTHAAAGSVTARAHGLVVTLSPHWRSGMPYTVTVADATRDGLFIVRPPGIGRNASRTPAQAEIGARLAYAVGFGGRKPGSPLATRTTGASDERAAGIMTGEGSPGHRFKLEFQVTTQNLTNRPNYVAIGNVMGSPLFGRPVSAAPARTIDAGVRFTF